MGRLFNDSVHLSDTSLLNNLGISAVLQYNNFNYNTYVVLQRYKLCDINCSPKLPHFLLNQTYSS